MGRGKSNKSMSTYLNGQVLPASRDMVKTLAFKSQNPTQTTINISNKKSIQIMNTKNHANETENTLYDKSRKYSSIGQISKDGFNLGAKIP